jgi:hypothetical protein|nr:MAG TPA: hypothetical protein [Caudoviricetes sp.]
MPSNGSGVGTIYYLDHNDEAQVMVLTFHSRIDKNKAYDRVRGKFQQARNGLRYTILRVYLSSPNFYEVISFSEF